MSKACSICFVRNTLTSFKRLNLNFSAWCILRYKYGLYTCRFNNFLVRSPNVYIMGPNDNYKSISFPAGIKFFFLCIQEMNPPPDFIRN